jgi:hypothetical protein
MTEKHMPELEFGTIAQACRIIGGDEKPVHFVTYYRGVKAGIYPPPVHPSPGISRVDLPKLREALRARTGTGQDA